MSEEILKALMQLFGIITKQDGGVTENERAYVKLFLTQQISLDLVEEYLTLYDKHADWGKQKVGDEKKLTSVKDSVRTLAICKKINKTLSQKQKVIVVIRLFELLKSDNNFTEQRIAIIDTASEVFNMPKAVHQLIESFITKDDIKSLESKDILLVTKDKTLDSQPESKHIYSKDLDGFIAILHIHDVDMYFFKYVGTDEIELSSLLISSGPIYLFAHGSIIKVPKSEPIFYSDIISKFLDDFDIPQISFNVENLYYQFPNGALGLRDINISEGPGKLLGIMGASGAGKTTLLNTLAGLTPPSRGEIKINGNNIFSQKDKIEGVIGYIAQDDILVEELTVYENLYFAAKLSLNNLSEKEIHKRVIKVLDNLGLLERKDLKVGSVLDKTISGGQRKRLNIALELIREPDVLFVDEPTSGLSSRDSENVMDLLKELTLKGKLIFVVIHQPSSDIYKMFDKMIILDTGGYQIYYGNPVEAVIYFKTATNQLNSEKGQCTECGNVNPEQIFNIIEGKVVDEYGNFTDKRKTSPIQWGERYQVNVINQKVNDSDEELPKNLHIPTKIKQWILFTKRDVLSKISNKQYIIINLVQAPLLAANLHYLSYEPNPDEPVINKNSFKAQLALLKKGNWYNVSDVLGDEDFDLFANELSVDYDSSFYINLNEDKLILDGKEVEWEAEDDISEVSPYNRHTQRGFIRFQLTRPDTPIRAFGHGDFSRVFSDIAIKLAKNPPQSENGLPNFPYTPKITQLLADYSASRQFSLTEKSDNFNFLYISPFDRAIRFNPNVHTSLLPAYKEKNYFYIGLKQVDPPQTISLLFRVDEGSSIIEKLEDLPQLTHFSWSYLSGELWKDFSEEAIEVNQTEGFKTSGIIQLAIPSDASLIQNRMPSGFVWVRVSFQGDPNVINDIIAIHLHAIEIQRRIDDRTNPDIHHLEAGSINKLHDSQVAIKGILQPYASFGGREKENQDGFYTRVAEIFRHKNRAISKWDYERLVLDHFPEIYKAKCLPHTAVNERLTNRFASRQLSVVVIPYPQLSAQNELPGLAQLQPKTDAITLDKIKKTLASLTAPKVDIAVVNPLYEEVLLDFKVRFVSGYDVGLTQAQLNRDLVRFLSPWAFREGQEIIIGGRFIKSEIIHFIESQPYVDFVKEVNLYHLISEVEECRTLGKMVVEPGLPSSYPPFTVKHQRGPGIGEMYILPTTESGRTFDTFLARLKDQLLKEGLSEGGVAYQRRWQEEIRQAQMLGLYNPGEKKIFTIGSSLELAVASSSRSVLVSAPRHRISPIFSSDSSCPSSKAGRGLGFMRIEIDFEVNERELLNN